MIGKKLYYISSYANESQHEMINSALLIALMNFYDDITVYSAKSSWIEIEKRLQCENEKIVFRKIYVVSGCSAIANLCRYIVSALCNICILLLSKRDVVLVYNFNNSFSLGLINVINKVLKRKILIFCHGELELLVDSSGGVLAKMLRFCCRRFFLKSSISSSLYFCVLGDLIKDNLNSIVGDRIEHFITIDHPYIFSCETVQTRKEIDFINIGTVGELNAFKGLDLYIKLIELLEETKKNDIKFSIIGRVAKEKDTFKKLKVRMPGENGNLLRADFELLVSSLDFVLFFYSQDKYQITASGAIFDAIKYRIPIIALRNAYFDYLFNKYGSIGYLCDSIEEMAYVILHLNKLDSHFCFDNYHNALNPQAISAELYSQMKQIFVDDIY